jgi:hypothetical protein
MALSNYNNAATYAIENYLDSNDFTEDQVELVGDLMEQARQTWAEDDEFAVLLLEKASTYVCADMDEDELETWVDLCIDGIAEFVGF